MESSSSRPQTVYICYDYVGIIGSSLISRLYYTCARTSFARDILLLITGLPFMSSLEKCDWSTAILQLSLPSTDYLCINPFALLLCPSLQQSHTALPLMIYLDFPYPHSCVPLPHQRCPLVLFSCCFSRCRFLVSLRDSNGTIVFFFFLRSSSAAVV